MFSQLQEKDFLSVDFCVRMMELWTLDYAVLDAIVGCPGEIEEYVRALLRVVIRTELPPPPLLEP